MVYYWAVSREQILMLDIYTKNEKENLSPDEIKMLRREVEDLLK